MKKEALGIWEYWPELLFVSSCLFCLVSPQARSPALAVRSLLDMAAEEGGAAAEPNVWRGKKVPPDVFVALTTRRREQSGIAKKQAEVLDLFFDETAVLRGYDQRELTEGGGQFGARATELQRKRGNRVSH